MYRKEKPYEEIAGRRQSSETSLKPKREVSEEKKKTFQHFDLGLPDSRIVKKINLFDVL